MANQRAHVFQINVSDGGVPKLAIPTVEVSFLGLIGDRQRDVEHHGGPERAVCLFSLERILALQAEGHPIYPGAIGENITIAGLEWAHLSPGAHLRLGDEVEIEITRYASPCNNIQVYFRGGEFARVSQKINPGWSRVCARVLNRGLIRVGDRVVYL